MKLALHWQILIGMVAGVLFGLLLTMIPWGQEEILIKTIPEKTEIVHQLVNGEMTHNEVVVQEATKVTMKKAVIFVNNWIGPFGSIFIKLLKLIAIPLILASLIKGIADLKDISKFSKIGGKTIVTYIVTTLVAIIIGLTLVNIVQPGQNIAQSTIDTLVANYANDPSLQSKISTADQTTSSGPLQFLEDIVPDNIFGAAANNGSMLQVIFFAILFGIGLLLIEPKKAKPVTDVIDGINDVILKIVDLIMLIAPFAVFALFRKLFEHKMVVKIGSNTLSIYIIHFIILYGSFTGIGLSRYFYASLTPMQAIIGAALFLVLVCIIVLQYYKYEAFIKAKLYEFANGVQQQLLLIKAKLLTAFGLARSRK